MAPLRYGFGVLTSITTAARLRLMSNVRSFSTTARYCLSTAEMSEKEFYRAQKKVNKDRLMKELHETCQWGSGQRWGPKSTDIGMSRLSLSDTDKQARDWFIEATQAAGCSTTVDELGNIFAIRPGKRDGPPTYAGSHLDTQPSGGRYDGILGITAAVEMLKVLNDGSIVTEYPIGVVNWTNEEGARFPISMVASGVWAGIIPLDRAHDLQEVGGGSSTMKSELERIGYLGSTTASHKSIPMAAHFELHIEQGPELEAEGRKVGVVTGVQAYRWYTVEVRGQDSHTGTTPLFARADALLAASKMILHSHRVATRLGARASTGIITAFPGSTNTIPGLVRFSLDFRARSNEMIEEAEAELKRSFELIAKGTDVDGLDAGGTRSKPCSVSFKTDSISPEIKFHDDCIKCVRTSANGLLGEESEVLIKDMVSGAGHDSVQTSYVCPTSMIFVPCRDGVSHNPREYSTPEDCTIGAQVLLGAVLRYDQLRARRA